MDLSQMVSDRNDEPFMDSGRIDFKLHAVGSNAEFVKVALDETKDSQSELQQGLARHASRGWGLDEPSLLLRVAGSLVTDETQKQQEVVRGVVQAASRANAWIFCGGLDFGIPNLVGTILQQRRHECESPLIGAVSWSAIANREQLLYDSRGNQDPEPGSKRFYTDGAPDEDTGTVSLQPNHSHFVIVDSTVSITPAEQARRDELSTKDRLLEARKRSFTFAHGFEEAVAEVRKAPHVLVVVGGDETTMKEIVAYAEAGFGIIVLASGTGGLAEALTDFMVKGVVPHRWTKLERDFEAFQRLNRKMWSNGTRRKSKRGASPSSPGSPSPGSPNLSDASSTSLADLWPLVSTTSETRPHLVAHAILDAALLVVSGAADRVKLSVQWSDPERFESELYLIPMWDAERHIILRDALQLALETESTECVGVALRFKAPIKDISLLKLYDKLYDKSQPPVFRLFKADNLPTDARHKEKLADDQEFNGQMAKTDPAWKVWDYYPKDVWATLKHVVPGLTLYWMDKVESHAKKEKSGGTHGALGCRWIDVYVWAIFSGNNEMATALLPACQEPMRAAIIGARVCNYMKEVLPLHAVELAEAALGHEKWACGLLDLCDNFDEARRMLVTKSRHWNRNVLQLAVQSKLRDFCAHNHCQLLCDEWLRGNLNRPEKEALQVVIRPTLTNPGMFGMLRIYAHALIPFELPGLQKMTQWHVPSNLEDDFETKSIVLASLPPASAFYEIPMVKLQIRLGVHLAYIALLSYVSTETVYTTDHPVDHYELVHLEFHNRGGLETLWLDVVLWLWTTALALDEWYKYAQDTSTYAADFWNMYDYVTISSTCIALGLRFFSVRVAVECLAFSVVLVWCRLFKYLQSNQAIGLLVIMITEMFNDIALWGLVSAIFLGAFTVAFVSIADPYVVASGGTDHPMFAPVWAMLGDYDRHEIAQWNPQVGDLMLGIYLVISQIVLVNLLIAMMGYTFGAIKERADEEWKFGRVASVMQATERMSPIPPPFNLPQTLLELIMRSCECLMPKPEEVKRPYKRVSSFSTLGTAMDLDNAALSLAKAAKQKVSRKLLRKLQLSTEQNFDKLGDLADNQKDLKEKQESLHATVQKIALGMEDITSLKHSNTLPPPRSKR